MKYLITDVDGVLTDGGFYYSDEGKILKKFGPHDSDGFKMFRKAGITPIAITADKRGYPITKRRMDDMQVVSYIVPAASRFDWIKDRYNFSEVIYIGDGYFDIPSLKEASFSVCPANAPDIVKQHANYVTKTTGGNGVILEVALEILNGN